MNTTFNSLRLRTETIYKQLSAERHVICGFLLSTWFTNNHRKSTTFSKSKRKSSRKPFWLSNTFQLRSSMADECLEVGLFQVYPWAVSGLESCVVVKSKEGLNVAFDIGYSTREAVKCAHVFISHGHMDHVAGLHSHASKRSLYGMPPATYYVLPQLIQPLRVIGENFSKMNESGEAMAKLKLQPFDYSSEGKRLSDGFVVQPFPTQHRVPSQGYLIYKVRNRLKPEFKGKDNHEIQALVKSGVKVTDTERIPYVAYTGDTMIDVFKSPCNPDILNVKLLITEATYVDNEIDRKGNDGVTRARNYGHTHLQEIVDNKHLFENVENIVLVHFSDKYTGDYVKKKVAELVPEDLKSKMHLGLNNCLHRSRVS